MIKRLVVHRFRGIREGVLDDLGKINLLIGPNNSGKTAILEMLYLGGTSGRPVQLILDDVPAEEGENLAFQATERGFLRKISVLSPCLAFKTRKEYLIASSQRSFWKQASNWKIRAGTISGIPNGFTGGIVRNLLIAWRYGQRKGNHRRVIRWCFSIFMQSTGTLPCGLPNGLRIKGGIG